MRMKDFPTPILQPVQIGHTEFPLDLPIDSRRWTFLPVKFYRGFANVRPLDFLFA